MRLRLIIVFPIAGLSLMADHHNLAYAASFDCTKAVASIEHIICDNAQLSDLDEHLGMAYTKATTAAPESDIPNLRSAQRAWIKSRSERCGINPTTPQADPQVLACLETLYPPRIQSLLAYAARQQQPLPATQATSPPQTAADDTTTPSRPDAPAKDGFGYYTTALAHWNWTSDGYQTTSGKPACRMSATAANGRELTILASDDGQPVVAATYSGPS